MDSPQPSLLKSALFPILFLWAIWLVFYFDTHYNLNLHQYGLKPRTLNGLIGIFTMPLLHGDIGHISSNTFPLLILGTLLFYFYKEIALKVFFIIYFACGILVWLMASMDQHTTPIHIGASGVIYGLSGFLFFSGIVRKHKALFGVSLIVTFLYGTVIWGIFPTEFQQAIFYTKQNNISWEGHLSGFLIGTLLAYAYRKTGIQKPIYSWDINNDADVDESNPYWMVKENEENPVSENNTDNDIIKNTSDNPYTITYTFVPKKDEEKK